MNYIEIINSIALIALTVAYFIQNNQLNFMKTMIDSFQPEKLKQAQEFIEMGKEHEFKIKMSAMSKEIINDVSSGFQSVHKDFLEQYDELLQFPMKFMIKEGWEKREEMLKFYPKNYQTLKQLLIDYDAGLLTEKEK
jgi:hypothetical protein